MSILADCQYFKRNIVATYLTAIAEVSINGILFLSIYLNVLGLQYDDQVSR